MEQKYLNLVGGEWIGAQSDRWFERYNPADAAELVGRFPSMSAPDVHIAIAAAHDAASSWRERGLMERGKVLLAAASLLRERRDTIARDLSRENGKTLTEAQAEVGSAAAFFEYGGGLARHTDGDLLADGRPGVRGWTQREPLGVVALITPWNDPAATVARKLAPALLCGNAVVLKPARETPLTAHHLARLLDEAGVPAGALNVVTGDAEEIGPALVESDLVRAISFTGSTRVGMHLNRQLAGRTTRLQTEMGGKNAVLVLADADLDLAADAIVTAACGQAGQRCTATSRVVVHRDVAEALLDRLLSRIRGLIVGPGLDPMSQVGALVSAQHLESVLAAVDQARNDGATVLAGGNRMSEGACAGGNFMAPALVVGVETHFDIWRKEIFGPVIAVVQTESFEQGLRLVNDSDYGLSSSIFTSDLESAHRFADAIDTGQVSINLPTIGWDVHVPFGGFRDSGSPFKEHGLGGLYFYSRVKSVMMRRA